MDVSEEERELVSRVMVVADGMALGRRVDLWSLILSAIAFAGVLMPVGGLDLVCSFLLLLSVVAASIQKIYALRVAFDESILRRWAVDWRAGGVHTTFVDDMSRFDRTLTELGLRNDRPGALRTTRTIEDRLQGAQRILMRQLVLFAVQLALILAVMALAVFRS